MFCENQSTAHLALPVYQYQIGFLAPDACDLPKYPGSAWRGAFGAALKKTVCVVRNTPCADCMLVDNCAYPYIFETRPPTDSEKMRKYNAVPHPFVLQMPNGKNESESIYHLNLTIFGHGQRFFPYFVHALQQAGQNGIGGRRQRFDLQTVMQISSNGAKQLVYSGNNFQAINSNTLIETPVMPDAVKIIINSPMRIKQQGKNLNPQTFNFKGFFNTLLRRISLLHYFHTDMPLEIDFKALSRQAEMIDFSQQKLEWFDWKRYSSRQKTEMNMGGVIGELQLEMLGKEAFWPYIWLGQWTHVGKGVSMGLGHYRVAPTSLVTFTK